MPLKLNVTFKNVPETGSNFGPLPLGKYPLKMHVDAYQHDAQGQVATNGNNEPEFWTTKAGDPMWKLKLEVLEGSNKGREIIDNFNFGSGGLKRVWVVWSRAGFVTQEEKSENLEFDPADFDNTFWWGTVEHDLAMEGDGKTPRAGKYPFDRKGCPCKVCIGAEGKNVLVNSKIGFAGYEIMDTKEAKKYHQPHSNGLSNDEEFESGDLSLLCAACQEGQHSHVENENNCPCDVDTHLPF